MLCLDLFPSLTNLTIAQQVHCQCAKGNLWLVQAPLCCPALQHILSLQNLVHIEGLQHCPQLQQLWLFENKISSMWGLQGCSQLERLFLYSNSISQIEGLETLTKLQVSV